jgi:FdhD protein
VTLDDEPNVTQGYRSLEVIYYQSKNVDGQERLDHIAEEIAVALVYNGISHAVMMATPTNLQEFALGFSLSEGIINSCSEVYNIELLSTGKGIEIHIEITSQCMNALKLQRRNLTGRTGCGLCGSESLEQAVRSVKQVEPQPLPSFGNVQYALSQLHSQQKLQALTGGVHGAAWCNNAGDIILLREDVGRHNALDKLIGVLANNKSDANKGFVLISSRASYEMVQKASSMNISTLVAVSAPTSLAISLANTANLNLLGFLREGRCSVYNRAIKITENIKR